jgi:hypothetical protein
VVDIVKPLYKIIYTLKEISDVITDINNLNLILYLTYGIDHQLNYWSHVIIITNIFSNAPQEEINQRTRCHCPCWRGLQRQGTF